MNTAALNLWSTCRLLNEDELKAAWGSYRATRDDSARTHLLEHYLPLVKHYGEWRHARLPSSVQLDEVLSAGIDGLRSALDAFNPDLGIRFETYCTTRVRGAILDYLRSVDYLPRQIRTRANHLARAREELTDALHRPPTNVELADYLGMPDKEFDRVTACFQSVQTVSLESSVSNRNDRPLRWSDTLASPRTEDPAAGAHRRSVRTLVLKGLSEPQRRIVILYYYEECTMKEVGAVLGLSESRVSQIHQDILDRLRENLDGRVQEFSA
jgi:RNA polymerase sigma factor FliA